jgi:hypothetical protein
MATSSKEPLVWRQKAIDCDVYKCDSDGHLILIQANKDRNEAEDLIRCPYHKCQAEIIDTINYYYSQNDVEAEFDKAELSLAKERSLRKEREAKILEILKQMPWQAEKQCREIEELLK